MKAVVSEMSGFCRDENLIRTGVLASTAKPEHHHQLCAGVLITRSGQEVRCPCPHHGDEEVRPLGLACAVCGDPYADVAKSEVRGRVRCTSRDECAGRVAEKSATNPAFAAMIERREETRARAAEIERLEGSSTPRRAVGRCEYSGAPTKGGRFFPGNDAKLKSLLATKAHTDQGALTELVYRGWLPEAKRGAYNLEMLQKAFDAARDPETADEKFQKRLSDRWARIEAGIPPEEAV